MEYYRIELDNGDAVEAVPDQRLNAIYAGSEASNCRPFMQVGDTDGNRISISVRHVVSIERISTSEQA